MAPKERPSRLDKALQERMYFISHIAATASTGAHNILVTGQSGNLYTVTLPTTPSQRAHCNCIDQRIRKTLCKHMLFTLLRVLKLPRSSLPTTDHTALPHLTTTLLPGIRHALSRVQCRDVEAPSPVRGAVSALAPGALAERARVRVPRRDVRATDECAICCEAFGAEALAFCERGCGNGVHRACFERYERAVQGAARCVLCRAVWAGGEVEIGAQGLLVGRRLVNVAEAVPEAFVEGGVAVRRLGLDRRGKERAPVVREEVRARKVEKEIRKGPSERALRAKAREERRRLAEGKGKGKGKGEEGGRSRRVTRSRRGTGV